MNYLSNKLAQALKSPAFPNQKRSTSLNPSAASIQFTDQSGNLRTIGTCHRQSFYKIKGYDYDDDLSVNVDWTLSAIQGDALHSMLESLLDQHGFIMGIQKLNAEHTIYDPKINLSGRSDLLAWDVLKQEPIGIEVKSIGEYKCKTAVEQPIEEHVLQAVVYLDYYNKTIPSTQKKINKWYLWYISRTENWTIKKKPHLSEFTSLWDFCIELDNNVPVVHLPGGVSQKWTQFSIDKIYERYNKLLDNLENNIVPDRDYELTYSEEKITALYNAALISKKTDRDTIAKWLDKGAPQGKLKVTMGDIECSFCEFNKRCWEAVIPRTKKVFSNLPRIDQVEKKEKEDLFFL